MKIKQKIINAFTLAETMVVLVVIGTIAVMILRSLSNNVVDRNKAMFKKAYSVTERTVAELVNDESLYPYDPARIGFQNTDQVTLPGETDPITGTDNLNEKFARLFAKKLNTIGEVNCDASDNGFCRFETTDGIAWTIPKSDFSVNNFIIIQADVNNNEGPNNADQDPAKDIFCINVYRDGGVNVTKQDGTKDTMEYKYLRSHNARKDDEDNNNDNNAAAGGS